MIDFQRKPIGHTYTLGLIAIFIRMACSAIGFRAASRALQITRELLPQGNYPSANGGQWWVLRLGLYELNRPKEQASDWVWMIDHTVQSGKGKCFLVVGVRLQAWELKRAEAKDQDNDELATLDQQDLSVWMIQRVDNSTGEAVALQLSELAERTGVRPRAILCDQGADVRRGAELFAAAKSEQDHTTAVVHDIAHAVANALKRQLNGCQAWEKFLADANKCKTAIRQTSLSFLMPPDLKSKARWMNLQRLVDWAERVRRFLEDPEAGLAAAGVQVEATQVSEKLGWLVGHTESLAAWTELMRAAAVSLKYVRRHGYHRCAEVELRGLLEGFEEGPAAGLSREVVQFVKVQSEQAKQERLLGSSEVLESLIGTGKQMQATSKNGFSKMVLGIAAKVVKISAEVISKALSEVSVSAVVGWVERNVGLSLQAQRRRALPSRTKEQKPDTT